MGRRLYLILQALSIIPADTAIYALFPHYSWEAWTISGWADYGEARKRG